MYCQPKRKTWSVIAAFAILVAGLWIFSNKEPSYQGHTLSYWLQALDRQSERDIALEAIDTIGVESIPLLLSKLNEVDSSLKLRLLDWLVRSRAIDDLRAKEISASTRRHGAVVAFTRLGVVTKQAIPDLLILTKSQNAEISRDAWRALAGVVGEDINRYLVSIPLVLQSGDVKSESLPTQ